MTSVLICESCAFVDSCPSASFNPFGNNLCGDYRSMKNKNSCKVPVETNEFVKECEKNG